MKKSPAILLLLCLTCLCNGQNLSRYEADATVSKFQNTVTFLADDMNAGRGSGTLGIQAAGQYIVSHFREAGLLPWMWNYTQSFQYRDTTIMRNVIGWVPSVVPSDDYVLVCAHYDHLGTINGTIYNGADDNASGVAALIVMAEMFAQMRREGGGPCKNLIFVAFDGKESSSAGAKHFLKAWPFERRRLTAVVNMDILGTDLVPYGKNHSYLIALGEETLPYRYRGYLDYLARRIRYNMQVGLDFYGSRDFTRMIYRTGDQSVFAEAGIPAVLLTSGFHQHTYKASDDADIINYPLLRRRTLLIFNFVNHLCGD